MARRLLGDDRVEPAGDLAEGLVVAAEQVDPAGDAGEGLGHRLGGGRAALQPRQRRPDELTQEFRALGRWGRGSGLIEQGRAGRP